MPHYAYHIMKCRATPAPVFLYSEWQPYAKGRRTRQASKDGTIEALERFEKKTLRRIGATVTTGWTGSPHQFSFHISGDRLLEAKQDWFRGKIKAMQEAAQAVTLESMLSNGFPSLDRILQNTEGDWIVLQDGRFVDSMPLDRLILELEPDREYYAMPSVLILCGD